MQCPVCRQDQVIVEWQGVELDLCIDGHGVWFDDGELRQLFAAAGVTDELGALEARLATMPRGAHGPRRRCPRCRRRMEHVAAPVAPHPVVLDRCPRGHGLWFDDGELDAILATGFAGDDTGLARVRDFLGQFRTNKEIER
jgi:Zn-finger nucleic acid-binding protein